MPELPDVAGFRQYLEATALHQRIGRTHIHEPRICRDVTPALISRRLKCTCLQQTHRHGKYLLARADHSGWLVLHFGMTGELVYEEQHDQEPDYAQFVLDLASGHRLVYTCRRMLGHISFFDSVEALVRDRNLGPDALDEELTKEAFARELRDRSALLKGLLMDQSFVAGLGNIWSDEVLFQAKLHPGRRADTLVAAEPGRLYRVMRRVLRTGAKRRGRVEELPESWLLPRREPGRSCPRCCTGLQQRTVAGRSTVLCPNCQTAPE